MFTLIVETWFFFKKNPTKQKQCLKELQSIPIMKTNFSRDSIYHSYKNTGFQSQSERQCTRKFGEQRCSTNGYKKNHTQG